MLGHVIKSRAEETPEQVAISVEGHHLTYAEFQATIERMSDRIARLPVPLPSAAILFRLHPCDAWAAMIALRGCGIDTSATDDPALLDALPFESPLVIYANKAPATGGDIDIAEPAPPGVASQALAQDGAHHLISSGSTGGLKVLRMDPKAEPAVAEARAALFGFSAETCFHIGNFGIWTAAGYKFPLAVWAAGGRVVIDRRPDFTNRFAEEGIDQAFLLPDQLDAFVNRRGENALPISGLRVITSGGFTSPATVASAASCVTARLTNIYTATEVNRTILIANHVSDPAEFAWLEPAPGAEVEIVDEEDQPSDEGQLRIRLSPGDCQGYVGAAPNEVFRGSWLYPGDLAARRDDGRIRLLGRADATIILNGQKRAAAPLEDAIRDQLAVSAVCLFSGQRRGGAAKIVLALESAAPPDELTIRAALSVLPSGHDVSVSCLPTFPRTTGGMNKIRREALRRMLFKKLDMNG